MASGIVYFFVGLGPLLFIVCFCGLEIGISLIQAQVFVVLTSSYIKDALELHSDSSSKKVENTNLYTKSETQCIKQLLSQFKNYCTKVKCLLNFVAGAGFIILFLEYNRTEHTTIGGNMGILNTPCRGRLQTLNLSSTRIRSYSTAETKDSFLVVKYSNVGVDKLRILSESKGRSGIYMFTHISSGKRYIGSSLNLRRRFFEYYNTNRLTKGLSMRINRALLKYGYSAFSLEILAY
jgi:hypothetical protein